MSPQKFVYHHYDTFSQTISFTAKRGREENDDEASPKKSRTTLTGHAHPLLTLPPECSTMDDDMDLGGDVEMRGAEEVAGSSSNPQHPWTPAPRLLHQDSNTSLSSSYAASSFPGTPLDFPEQYGQLSNNTPYPSAHNPTSFTDQNGVTRTFAPSSLPNSTPGPLSIYSPTSAYDLDEASAFASYALQHGHKSATGTIEIQQPGSAFTGDGVVRSIDMPRSYGWDSPSQRMGMGMGMGSHLV